MRNELIVLFRSKNHQLLFSLMCFLLPLIFLVPQELFAAHPPRKAGDPTSFECFDRMGAQQ
jgi:hypothetical protein